MSQPIACTLAAADRVERERAIRSLMEGADRIEELDDGLALTFSGSPRWLRAFAELTALERECCRFLHFELRAEPDRGPIHVRITGPRGARDVLRDWIPGSRRRDG